METLPICTTNQSWIWLKRGQRQDQQGILYEFKN